MGQDFHWNFLLKVTRFLRLSLVCLTESRSFGYGLKDLISPHKVVVKVVQDRYISDDVTSGTRDMVKEGQLRAVQGSMC